MPKQSATTIPPAAKAAEPTEPTCLTAVIEVPLTLDPPPAIFPIHINVQLGQPHSTLLRRITRELDAQDVRLEGGAHVGSNHGRAIKWILEQVAAALPSE